MKDRLEQIKAQALEQIKASDMPEKLNEVVPQRAQPLSLVAIIQLGTLVRLPWITRRKVGMTPSVLNDFHL